MADVSLRPGDRRDGSRGQVFLLAAVGLAVVLVVLAVLVNSSIYTENLATRDSEIAGANDALEYRTDIESGVGTAIEGVNRGYGDSDYAARNGTHLPATVASWEETRANYSAIEGGSASASLVGGRRGTLVRDNNSSTQLLPRGGAPVDWTLARDAKVRGFAMRVEPTTSLSDSDVEDVLGGILGDDVFTFVVDDGTTEWSGAVYRNLSGTPKLKVYDGGSYATCSGTGTNVSVNVADGRFDGRSCPALDEVSPTGTAEVRFLHGDEATGTYELTVDRAEPIVRADVDRANYGNRCAGETFYDVPGSGTPYTEEAVYAATVNASYRSSDVVYATQVRVAPDEPGAPAAEPYAAVFDVDDPSGGDGQFDVDWQIEDPDDDLSSVTIDVENDDDFSTVATLSGDSGSATVGDSTDANDQVTFQVTLSDAAGNTRGFDLRHVDDGGVCP